MKAYKHRTRAVSTSLRWVEGLIAVSIVAVKSLRDARRLVRAIHLDGEIKLGLHAVAGNLPHRLDTGIEADPAAHSNRAGEPDLLQSRS